MIKRFCKIMIIILILTVNVRVKALSVNVPHKCNLTEKAGESASHGAKNTREDLTTACAVHSQDGIDKMKMASAEVHMSIGASVLRETGSEIKVVRGLVRVAAKNATRVKTLYGEIFLADGEVLIEAVDSLVKFTNLSSESLKYTPLGEKMSHDLPVGFATYYAQVTTSGVADTGYPHPAEIEPLIRSWSKLYPRSEKKQLVHAIKDFMVSWKGATEMVGSWYLDTVEREIASQQAEEDRIARLKAKRDAENLKMRDMFRQRVFEE